MAWDITQGARQADRIALVICVLLSVAMLSLGAETKRTVAGHLNRFLTYPWYRLSTFVNEVGRVGDENDRLRGQVAALQAELDGQERLRRERDDLRRALGFREAARTRLVPCEVVKRRYSKSASQVLVVHPDSVVLRPYQPVIAPTGLVGRVSSVLSPGRAWVELITSPGLALCCEVQRTGLPGILRPREDDFVLTMVGRDEDLRVGDRIVSSDIAAVLPGPGEPPIHAPRGIPVGEVVAVSAPPEQIFKQVLVRCFADFTQQRVLFAVFGEADWLQPPPLSPATGDSLAIGGSR